MASPDRDRRPVLEGLRTVLTGLHLGVVVALLVLALVATVLVALLVIVPLLFFVAGLF